MDTKCVIFDVDWVLVNSWGKFSQKYQKEFDIPYEYMLEFFNWVFKECLIWEKDIKTELEPFLEKWQWNSTVDELLIYWFESENNINFEMMEIIRDLKDKWIICIYATDNERCRTEYIKETMWFWQLFDEWFSSCFLHTKKTNPEYFALILSILKSKYNIEPNEVMLFDDDEKNIESALTSWINAKLFTDFDTFIDEVKKI